LSNKEEDDDEEEEVEDILFSVTNKHNKTEK